MARAGKLKTDSVRARLDRYVSLRPGLNASEIATGMGLSSKLVRSVLSRMVTDNELVVSRTEGFAYYPPKGPAGWGWAPDRIRQNEAEDCE